ncbi:DEAD/DEAH box helicase [Azospirillum tabaci]|uniref:DEAD/DEAH box helicase n=1 Tax=Azospirillum tabaci TaxID=2752310 RepID=UPI001660B4A3|nr:DEAD/DEAH box helicase [Azospirillum tabaci]
MTHRFAADPQSAGVEIRLIGPAGPLAVDRWAVTVPDSLLPGVDLAQRLIAADSAIADSDLLLIEHRAVAGLSNREASALGLPPPAPVVAHLRTRGVITSPSFTVELEWRRPTGQPVVGATRTGAFLRIGGKWGRLSDALFQIVEGVDRVIQAAGDDQGARFAAMSALREVLPAAIDAGTADADGLIGTMTIAVADSFSLDLRGDGDAARLVPILHRAGDAPEQPLLSEDRQRIFGEDQFNRFTTARSVYALGGNWYAVTTPVLRRALEEVRRVQSAPPATRRALFASPRAFLRDALGPDLDDTVLETVFRETAAYADRVVGLGLWRPRVVPWVPLAPTDWFGDGKRGDAGGNGGPAAASPPPSGLMIGDRAVPLTEEEANALRARVEDAIGAGLPSVSVLVDGQDIPVPATTDTLAALNKLAADRMPKDPPPPAEPTSDEKSGPEVLLIRPNEEAVEVEGQFSPRPASSQSLPPALATPLKPHQTEGLSWLQQAWTMGRPGVLLADDMGLGKTLQGLAFLAWLRTGMAEGAIPRAPVAVVAPTGLLQNWRAEADRHLVSPGLGHCTEAFGRGLAALKRRSADGSPALDVDALQSADWVLTTYETLRDFDRDFGKIRFAAMLFDEAQKIKTPGVRLTDAAKAMNADFRIAMTGTPVENRLSDLWCITDAIHPAVLGELKSFSADYERSPDPERLKRLKSSLDAWHGGRAPLLLRRLKQDRLPDLPLPQEIIYETPMPPVQRNAYESAITEARTAEKAGAMLGALQRMRAISLHPAPDSAVGDDAFIAASARLTAAFTALDDIAQKGERVLIFLEDLAMQARLAGILQRRYRLLAPPMIISGQVAGTVRQARVDRFQASADKFDAMILSPRAGGVGLTLTNANHVIHLSRWWNPAVEDQCTGRALRIGQTKPVFVHIPMAVLGKGCSAFDRNLNALLTRKRRLFHEALMPPSGTAENLNELFAATVTTIA